jgi:hypothetical protein
MSPFILELEMNNTQHVTVKIPRAKAYNCVVYPNNGGDVFTIQAKNRIFQASLANNKLVYSVAGKNTFMHLNGVFGAKVMELPVELADQLKNLVPMGNAVQIL